MCASFLPAAAVDVFISYYDVMLHTINPDDLTPTLFARRIITETDKSNIDSQNNHMQKTSYLLKAVQQTIMIDDNNFEAFLTILKSFPKYVPLFIKMSAGAKQLGM